VQSWQIVWYFAGLNIAGSALALTAATNAFVLAPGSQTSEPARYTMTVSFRCNICLVM
jgi:hypothetical protein